MKTLCLVTLLTIVGVVLADDIVTIKQGRIRGHRLTSRRGRDIFAFQGIPYAKPPLGKLRFKPPQPADPWVGVLNATEDPPMCIQRGLFLTDDMLGQEDCLYLNVYTTKLPKKGKNSDPLDVMFWIHGGGFHSGSGSIEHYGPQHLLDKNVLLVTINYRLGPLGFLSTGDAVCPGNNGLKDQTAALHWVRDNIAAFGGNPNSVTIFGESAGGASVELHMLSPASKGLFHRAISQSGSALCPWAFAPNGTTRYQAEKLATLLNCPTSPSKALVSCLRKLDGHAVIKKLLDFLEWNIDPMIPFKPVIETEVGKGDKPFIVDEPKSILLNPETEDLVPWMAGFLSNDGAIMTAIVYEKEELVKELDQRFDDIIPMAVYFRETAPEEQKVVAQQIRKFYFGDQTINNYTIQQVSDMYTDAFFFSGIDPSVKLHSQRSAPVYYYHFEYRGTNSHSTRFGESTRDYGVCHLDELMYLFPQSHLFPGTELSVDDEEMVNTIITLWTNFAHTGNPTPDGIHFNKWYPVFSPYKMEFAHINYDGITMGHGLNNERAKFWNDLPHRGSIPSLDKDEL